MLVLNVVTPLWRLAQAAQAAARQELALLQDLPPGGGPLPGWGGWAVGRLGGWVVGRVRGGSSEGGTGMAGGRGGARTGRPSLAVRAAMAGGGGGAVRDGSRVLCVPDEGPLDIYIVGMCVRSCFWGWVGGCAPLCAYCVSAECGA